MFPSSPGLSEAILFEREAVMDHTGCLKSTLLLALILGALSGAVANTQIDAQPVNDLPKPYERIRNWGTLPEGRKWGPTSGVAVDRDGRSVWVAERCQVNSCAGSSLPAVLKFDSSGKLVRSFGAGMFVWPHSIHVDTDGNVWVVDARGANAQELEKFPDSKDKGHVVVKFSPEGKVLMTLGKKGVAGDPPDALNEPNDVVTAPNGDIFVADGHSGRTVARIVKYDRNGKFIKSWGSVGSAQGEFRTPHAVVIDSRGRLIAADRGNHRIQIFDQEGNFLEMFTQFSRTSGLDIDAKDTLYAADSESNAMNHPGWIKGIRIGSARDGKALFIIPGHKSGTPEDTASEGVAVDAAGNVYGAETADGGITKYVKR
jgi:sugar lactone lactonase YvrE